MKKKLLNSKEVCDRYSISRVTLWRRVNSGQIPPPVKINTINYWLEEHIEEHITNLIGDL